MSDNSVVADTKQSSPNTGDMKNRSFFLTGLPLFVLAHGAHHLMTALHQPMLPYMQQEFNLNYTKSAAITSAFSISGGASQLPSGWLADRMGPAVLITMGIFGVAVGGLFIGLSQSYLFLIAALIFMGLMSGGYHPASTPLISMSVPVHQRGRAIGIHLVGGTGMFFLTPIIASFIAGIWGWRGVYLTLAIPSAIFGISFFFYLNKRYDRSRVEEMKRKQTEERPPQPGYKRRLWAFMIMMVLGGGAGATVHSFLTLYIVDVLGATKAQAAMALSFIFVSGFYGAPLGGYISDKIGSVKVIIATDILSGLIIFGLISVQEYGMAFKTILFTMGAIQAIRFPVAEVFIMSQSPAKHRSTIYGIYYSTMQYTGAIFAPIMGYFIDLYGFGVMFNFSAVAVTAVAVITAFFIWDAKD